MIMTYAFGKSYKRLEAPDFGKAGYEALHQGSAFGVTTRHIIIILRATQALPEFILYRMGGAFAALVTLKSVRSNPLAKRHQEKLTITRVFGN